VVAHATGCNASLFVFVLDLQSFNIEIATEQIATEQITRAFREA